jgi:C-terminal processing protease CtpA/Prc
MSMMMIFIGLEQKNVIIQRDRFGYGLTVSGDNPVYVLSVREGGAAHRAGINTNDQIIKVKFLILNLVFFIFSFIFTIS